jgi:uncharacterized protein (DUF1684 family)
LRDSYWLATLGKLASQVTTSSYLELLDWRRQVSELFAELRRRSADAETLAWFRARKDALFREHPQSPIPEPDRLGFGGLRYWPFDPSARVVAQFTAVEDEPPRGTDEIAFRRIGHLAFELQGRASSLAAFWIEGYAGGLFVPFTDGTSGRESYGGGRYLLDTIKSADHGSDAATGTVVLDFNYGYHPSCAYDPQWVCPLAPPDSRLAVPVRAGERLSE